jgi:anti-sigma regulatory factor (Ser/Thr protein kinase)
MLICGAFDRWGLDSEHAVLVVSELVTNAYTHACQEGPTKGSALTGLIVVRAWLRDDGQPVIEVWDCVPDRKPVCQPFDLDRQSGRGIVLIEALCKSWGCRPLACGGGKVVWALL